MISDAQRLEYLARSPYNIVHLTLPDSEEQAARDLADVARATACCAEAPERYWWVAQDYTGPRRRRADARGHRRRRSRRRRTRTGEVLPHERTHAGPKEGRLRLLRATRTQLEPIFLLYDAEPAARAAGRRAGCRRRRRAACARGSGRVDAGELELDDAAPDRRRPPPLRDRGRLPRGAAGGDAHLRDPRLVARARARDLPDPPASCSRSAPCPASRSRRRTAALDALPRRARSPRVDSDDDFGHARRRVVRARRASSTRRTPPRRSRPSTAARPRRRSCCSPSPSTQVARFARAGETMPQKSTFFYPKLTSGLLFFPVA